MMTETTTTTTPINVPERPAAPQWDARGNPSELRRNDPEERYIMDEVEARLLGVLALARKGGSELTSYEDLIREFAKHTPDTELSFLHYAVYFLWPDETKTMRDAAVRLQAIRNG